MNDPRLPEGYAVVWEADLLVLRRPDGSEVAVFSEHGARPEEIVRAAREDLRNPRGLPSIPEAKRGAACGRLRGRTE